MGLFSKVGKMLPKRKGTPSTSVPSDDIWVRGDTVTHFPPYTTAQVVKNFNGTVADELSVTVGHEVRAVYRDSEWIYVERKDGKRGFVPDEYCRIRLPRTYDYASATLQPPSRTKISRRESQKIKKEFLKQSKEIERKKSPSQGGGGGTTSMGTVGSTRGKGLRRADTFHAGDKLDVSSLQRFLESLPVDKKEGEPFVKAPQGTARVRFSFDNRNGEEVTIGKGEEVVILNTSDPDWTYVRNPSGEEGFVPSHCLKGFPSQTPDRPPLDLFVLEGFKAECDLDLSTKQSEWLKALYPEVDGWIWAERQDGTRGFMPGATSIVASHI